MDLAAQRYDISEEKLRWQQSKIADDYPSAGIVGLLRCEARIRALKG